MSRIGHALEGPRARLGGVPVSFGDEKSDTQAQGPQTHSWFVRLDFWFHINFVYGNIAFDFGDAVHEEYVFGIERVAVHGIQSRAGVVCGTELDKEVTFFFGENESANNRNNMAKVRDRPFAFASSVVPGDEDIIWFDGGSFP